MSKQNMILSCKDGDAPTYKALLYMPSPIGHSYSSQLAVDISDVNNPSAIQDSTGYLIWPENTNKQHWFDVMDNMLKLPISNVENRVAILVCNAYTGWNFGHNLSTMLFCIRDTLKHYENGAFIVVNARTLKTCLHTATLLRLYFPDESRWLIIPEDIVVHFTSLVIPNNHWYHLQHEDAIPIISDLGTRLMHTTDTPNMSTPDRVALFKFDIHKSARRMDMLDESTIVALRDLGWCVPDIESMNILELIRILRACQVCICGTGAINYAHRRFISPDAHIVLWGNSDHSYVGSFKGETQSVIARGRAMPNVDKNELLQFILHTDHNSDIHRKMNPPSRTMVKMFTVTKNEYDMIEDWIQYHGNLLGYENITVIDNGSSDERVLQCYSRLLNEHPTLTIVTELGYHGRSQGDHFTKHMRMQQHTCHILMGLDTDQFICTTDYECDATSIHNAIQVMIDSPACVFRKAFTLNSVPDPESPDFHDRVYTRPAVQCTTFQHIVPVHPELFIRSKHFERTMNGNHFCIVNCSDPVMTATLGCFHFHYVGRRRSIERAGAICQAYGYYDKDDNWLVQFKKLQRLNSGNGIHRIIEYRNHVIRQLALRSCIQEFKRIPSEQELNHTGSNLTLNVDEIATDDIFTELNIDMTAVERLIYEDDTVPVVSRESVEIATLRDVILQH